jgi:hypothetical protein
MVKSYVFLASLEYSTYMGKSIDSTGTFLVSTRNSNYFAFFIMFNLWRIVAGHVGGSVKKPSKVRRSITKLTSFATSEWTGHK